MEEEELTPEERARLDKVIRNAPLEEDRLLWFGPDLNAVQRMIEPIPKEAEGIHPMARTPQEMLKTNALLNVPRLGLDALQVINSPFQSLVDLFTLGKGAYNTATGPAIRRLAGIDLKTDPSAQMFREAGRGFKEQFTSGERFMERPLDPLATLLAGARLPLTKAGVPLRVARQLEDPGMAMVAAGARGAKAGAGKVKEALGARGISRESLPRPVENIVARLGGREKAKTTARDLAVKGTDVAFGFSTSTGDLVQKIVREAPSKGKKRLLMAYGGPILGGSAKKRKARESLVRISLEAADIVKRKADDFQEGVKTDLLPFFENDISPKGLERLKKDALLNVKEFNAQVSNQFKINIEDVPMEGATSLQRDILPSSVWPEGKKQTRTRGRTGDVSIEFEDFPSREATRISGEGPGRAIVVEMHKRLVDAPPTSVGALQQFMFEIDDLIKVTDTELGVAANQALMGLRRRIRELLGEELGPKYEAATLEYEKHLAIMNNLKMQIGVEPGLISPRGIIGADPGTNVEGILNGVLSALDSADELAYGTLLKLEEASGVRDITTRAAGVRTQSLMGTGLVVRSEIAQNARGVTNALKGIPANVRAGGVLAVGTMVMGWPFGLALGAASSVVFSPKLLQQVVLRAPPHLRGAYKKALVKARGVMEAASRAGHPVSEWVQRGATIEQVMNRLGGADPGPFEAGEENVVLEPQREQPVEQQEQTRSFLDRLGSMDTNPLTGIKLER